MSEKVDFTPEMRAAVYVVCRFVGKVGANRHVEVAVQLIEDLGSSTDGDYAAFLAAVDLEETNE